MALQVQESPGTGEDRAWHSTLPPRSDSHLRRKECREECVNLRAWGGGAQTSECGQLLDAALKIDQGRQGRDNTSILPLTSATSDGEHWV